MKRVFQVSEITTLCNELKILLNGCKTHISNMKTYADQIEAVLDAVPDDVRYSVAVQDVSKLRSALKTEQMDIALIKLENCRQRACELIPVSGRTFEGSHTSGRYCFPLWLYPAGKTGAGGEPKGDRDGRKLL